MTETRPLPWYYLVNDRPVKMVATTDGGMDVLAYDFKSHEFVRNFDYLTICLAHTTDVDSVDEATFNARLDQLRSQR